jgi:hypothetical protein
LHHAGYSADAQGSTHQAGKGSVQCGVGEGEYVAGIRASRKRRVYTVEYGLIRGSLRAGRI